MTEDTNFEDRKRLYAETRADLLKRQLSNSENADRAILSVSTASLGFSLAFIKDIVRFGTADYQALLYLSWLLFALAIITTLVSFYTSQKAIDEQLEIAENYYLKLDESAIFKRPKYAGYTEKLNISGAFLLVAGILFTCIFVATNLTKGEVMSEKGIGMDGAMVPNLQRAVQTPNTINKGANIPALQGLPVNPNNGATVPSLQQIPSPPTSTDTSK